MIDKCKTCVEKEECERLVKVIVQCKTNLYMALCFDMRNTIQNNQDDIQWHQWELIDLKYRMKCDL